MHVCVHMHIVYLSVSVLTGQGDPYNTWTESLKPKHTVANSPVTWLLLEIVDKFSKTGLQTITTTVYTLVSLFALHSPAVTTPLGGRSLQHDTTTARNERLSRSEAQTDHCRGEKCILLWHRGILVSLLAIQ